MPGGIQQTWNNTADGLSRCTLTLSIFISSKAQRASFNTTLSFSFIKPGTTLNYSRYQVEIPAGGERQIKFYRRAVSRVTNARLKQYGEEKRQKVPFSWFNLPDWGLRPDLCSVIPLD